MITSYKSKIAGSGLALLMLPALAATAKADTRNHALVDPTVTIFNQKAQGQSVAVSYAHLPKPVRQGRRRQVG